MSGAEGAAAAAAAQLLFETSGIGAARLRGRRTRIDGLQRLAEVAEQRAMPNFGAWRAKMRIARGRAKMSLAVTPIVGDC